MTRNGCSTRPFRWRWPLSAGSRFDRTAERYAQSLDKIRAASEYRTDPDFVIIARTDARAVTSLEDAIDRGNPRMHQSAKNQVASWRRGRNGLASQALAKAFLAKGAEAVVGWDEA